MNAFFERYQNSIRLQYRCFDRLLLNGLTQPFQQAFSEEQKAAMLREAKKLRSVLTLPRAS
jgi:hypothetical protein